MIHKLASARGHRTGVSAIAKGPVIAIALAILASSCAQSPEDFQRAVELALGKGTARMEGETVVSGSGEAEEGEVRIQMTAAIDLKADKTDLTITMQITPPPKDPGPKPCKMVVDKQITYLAVAGSPKWLRTTLFPLDQAEQPLATDPRKAFDFLKAVFGDYQGVGTEQVRGVQTRHWRVFVDIDRLLEKGPEKKGGFFSSLSNNKLPMDVWIDLDGLLRKIEYTISDQIAGTSIDVRSSTEIFDYGQPLTIETPPLSQVSDEPNPAKALLVCLGAPV